ncbi:HNH endonuclease [Vibrio rarus]|uniref:HNH endonuclease n=1 Tax=Vibrio rarus TaxID=413403 RepID=UPI0021C414C4|nr:HNH endonuclease [Vibrio rarus]
MRSDVLRWSHYKGGAVNEPFIDLFRSGPVSREEFRFIMENSSENVRRHEHRHYLPIMQCLNAIHYSEIYRYRGIDLTDNDFINGKRVNFISFLNRLSIAPISDSTFQKLIISDNTTANFQAKKQNVIPLANTIRTLANNLHDLPMYSNRENDLGGMHSADKVQYDLDKEISESMKDTSENRRRRLKSTPNNPEKIQTVSTAYRRNPDVIVEVLLRANGICERCKKDAPFRRRKDETPYLEVHHIIRLADGGVDSVENALALCPNCHRELHFGSEY